jgi:AraC-like DNA-binding protein
LPARAITPGRSHLLRATTRTLVPEGMVRIAPTMAVPSLLREHGVDPVPLLAEFGLTTALFDEPENVIPYEKRSRLLSRCAEATRCPHFGLLAGQRAGLSSFGLVGFLMQSAPNVRAALEAAAEHFRLHNPNATIEFLEDDGFVHFSHIILRPDFTGREQIVDMSAAIMFNAMRVLCGHGEQPREVRLARKHPADPRPYQRYFQARVVFDANDTGLTAPAKWLERSLATADPLLHLMMGQRIAELAAQAGEGIASRLRRRLPGLLAAHGASVTAAAESLGMTVRTLNRRLAAEGTSFAALRDEARYAMARQLLRGTATKVSEIAEQLGYANASALSAAFRRWSGQGPSEWRAARTRSTRQRTPRKSRLNQ